MPPGSRRVPGIARLAELSPRAVGAGVAMAATAVLAIALWLAGVAVLSRPPDAELLSSVLPLVASGAPPAVLGAALLAAVLWDEYLPDPPAPRYGALYGSVTALGSVLAAGLGIGCYFSLVVAGDTEFSTPVVLLTTGPFLAIGAAIGAVAAAGWVAVPLGTLGGWLHERLFTGRSRDEDAASSADESDGG